MTLTRSPRSLHGKVPDLLALTATWFAAILVVACLSLMGILGFALVNRAQSDARSIASALMQYAIRTIEVAALVAKDAEAYLVAREELADLATDPDAHAHFRELEAALPPGSSIIFVDRGGTVKLRSDEFPASPVDLSDRDWFERLLAGADQVKGQAIMSRVSHRKIFVYADALRSADGTFLGAVNLGIPSDAIMAADALPQYGEGVSLTIFRDDGHLIARNDFPDDLLGQRFALPAEVLAEGELTRIASRLVDGRYSVKTYFSIPDYGLVVVASIPLWNVLKPLLYTLAGGIPILGLVLGGSYLAVARMRAQQTALAEGSAKLEMALEAAHLGAWHWNLRTHRVDINSRFAEMLGYSPGEIEPHYRLWDRLIHPEDRQRAREAVQAHIDGHEPIFRSEYRMRHKSGSWVWVLDSGRVVQWDEAGQPRIATGTLLDLTDRKAAEERLKLISAEVDHRSKNMLAVLQAVIKATRSDSAEDLKARLQGRIFALARAHELLAENRWDGVSLPDLVAVELAAYNDDRQDRISFSGPSVVLMPRASQALAMVLHELTTNALKYGALSHPHGRLSVSWSLEPGSERTLNVIWRENVRHRVSAPETTGFGSTVIQASIESQLGGSLAWDWSSTGLICQISIPGIHLQSERSEMGAPFLAARPRNPRKAVATFSG